MAPPAGRMLVGLLPPSLHRPALAQCRLGLHVWTAEACEDIAPSPLAVVYQDSRASTDQSAPPPASWEPERAGDDNQIPRVSPGHGMDPSRAYGAFSRLSTRYRWISQPNLITDPEGLPVGPSSVAIFLLLLLVPHLTPHILVSRLKTVPEV